MGWAEFETPNARYTLLLGEHAAYHGGIFSEKEIESLDALVLEGFYKPKALRDWDQVHRWHFMTLRHVASAKSTLPIYSVDYWPNEITSYMERMAWKLAGIVGAASACVDAVQGMPPTWWQVAATAPIMLHGVNLCNATEQKQPILNIVGGLGTVPYFLPLVGARNVLAARKVDGYVAQKVASDHKPHIGMVYASGHSGIEWHLRMPRVREAMHRLIATLGLYLESPEVLDEVREYRISNEGLILIGAEPCGLYQQPKMASVRCDDMLASSLTLSRKSEQFRQYCG